MEARNTHWDKGGLDLDQHNGEIPGVMRVECIEVSLAYRSLQMGPIIYSGCD